MHYRRAFSSEKVKQPSTYPDSRIRCSNSCEKNSLDFRSTSNGRLGKPSKRVRYEDPLLYKQQQQPFFTGKTVAIRNLINDYFKDEDLQERMAPVVRNRLSRRIQLIRGPELRKKSTSKKEEEEELSKSLQINEKNKEILNWNVNKKISHLPPINEIMEDLEDGHPQERSASSFYEASVLTSTFRSSSSFSEYYDAEKTVEEKMFLTFENQIFQVFVILKEGKPASRLKSFKLSGMPILERELKIKNYGMPAIWGEAKINPYTYETGMQPPLKDLVCKVGVDEVNPLNLKIRVKPLFKRLSANGFQELRSLMKSFCLDLLKVKGKVINNKVNPQNIFLTKEYKMCLAEWGYSSFRDSFSVQSNSFESRLDPILRGQRDWFVSPEYLAPEIVSNMLGNPPQDIWKGESSPDIWSLGLVIYEMMTLVPIWSTAKCSVSCKSSECSTIPNVDKAGLLGMPGRDLKKLQSRQMTVQRQLIRQMQNWSEGDRDLGKILLRMLQPKLQLRIGWDRLISEL